MAETIAVGRVRAPMRLVRRFGRDDSGATVIVFAVMIVPLLALILGVVDIGRAHTLKGSLQHAADAAIHTASLQLPLGAQRAEQAFAVAFRENLPENLKDHAYELTVAEDASALEVKIEGSIDTTLLGVVGRDRLGVKVAAKAERAVPTSAIAAQEADTPAIRREIESTGRRVRNGFGLPQPERASGQSSGTGVAVHGGVPEGLAEHLKVPPEDQQRIRDLEAEWKRKLEALTSRYR